MINKARREFMRTLALFGLGSVVALAVPTKMGLRERKSIIEKKEVINPAGYYGFSETW